MRQRGFKKSAEELRMGIPALRQYIDTMMPVAPKGNGVQICSVHNFQIFFRGFFIYIYLLKAQGLGFLTFLLLVYTQKNNIAEVAVVGAAM
jgi:hypothetical protein